MDATALILRIPQQEISTELAKWSQGVVKFRPHDDDAQGGPITMKHKIKKVAHKTRLQDTDIIQSPIIPPPVVFCEKSNALGTPV